MPAEGSGPMLRLEDPVQVVEQVAVNVPVPTVEPEGPITDTVAPCNRLAVSDTLTVAY